MSRPWCTKEDVLNDLEVVGLRNAEFDNEYCVYGEQPPPVHSNEYEDDEFKERFGEEASQDPVQGEVQPDLMGITQMLRMVQNYENCSSDEELPVSPSKNIVISKPHSHNVCSPESSSDNIQKNHKLPNINLAFAERNHKPNKKLVLDEDLNLNVVNNKTGDTNLETNLGLSKTDRKPRAKQLGLSKCPSKKLKVDDVNSNNEFDSHNSQLKQTKTESSCDIKKLNSSVQLSSVETAVKLNTSTGIIISKLNPFVNEFVPRGATISSHPCNNTENKLIGDPLPKTAQQIDIGAINDKKLDKVVVNTNTTLDKTKAKSDENLKEEKQQMALMLRNKISIKNDTIQKQLETNKAIVNLLKLYAEPKASEPLKLLTPKYFETCKTSTLEDKVEKTDNTDSLKRMTSQNNVKETSTDETYTIGTSFSSQLPATESNETIVTSDLSTNSDIVVNVSYVEEDVVENNHNCSLVSNDSTSFNNLKYAKIYDKASEKNDILKDDKSTLHNNHQENNATACAVNVYAKDNKPYDNCEMENIYNIEDNWKENTQVEEIEETQLTPDLEEISIENSTGQINDSDITTSIHKVNNWLNNKPVVNVPDKRKSPMLYLGAVAYKRKDTATPISQRESSVIEVIGKKMLKASEYKPSSYAEELHKKYSEHTKVQKSPPLNIWEKLEADLKKKDLEVKKRKNKS